MRNLSVALLAGVMIFFSLWMKDMYCSLKEHKTAISVSIDILSDEEAQGIKIYQESVNSVITEMKKDTLVKDGYLKNIQILMPRNIIDKIKQVRINIGKNNFTFSQKGLLYQWINIKSGPEYIKLKTPDNVRAETAFLIPRLKKAINWPGDLVFIRQSFSFIYMLMGAFTALGMFLYLKYQDKIAKRFIIKGMKDKIVKSKNVKISIIIAGSLLLGFFIFGENIQAKFGITDDHQIMSFSGDDGKLFLKEVPSIFFKQTEISSFGNSLRFRPSYYFMRLLEISLWGRNTILWYLTRIIIFSIFITALWYLVEKWVGLIFGLIFSMAVISYEYWADIFSRLGPAELYAVLGIALYFLGFFLYFEKDKRITQNKRSNAIMEWLFMLVGAVIAIGSKENFLLLILPVIYIFIYSIVRKRFNFTVLTSSLLIGAYCFLIIIAIYSSVLKKGIDIYCNAVSMATIFALLKNELISIYSLLFIGSIFILVLLISIFYLFKKREYSKENLKRSLKITFFSLFVISILYFVYLSQIIFYNGAWPSSTRYDFPGMLAVNFLFLILCVMILNICNYFGLGKDAISRIKVLIYSFFISIILFNGFYAPLRVSARENVQRTSVFTSHIEKIVDECQKHSDYPIIFQSHSYGDYEPAISVGIFLRAYRVKNPIYLKLTNYLPEDFKEGTLEKVLTQGMLDWSKNGDKIFNPISELKIVKNKCYSIDFSGCSDKYGGCINLGKIF